MVDTLHFLLGSPVKRKQFADLDAIPQQSSGLYFFFQNGESYSTRDNMIIDRIVRVGISGNLRNRLKFHYQGNIANSSFRNCVRQALLNDAQPFEEAHITQYIQENFTFSYVLTNQPAVFENPISALLSQCPYFNHSLQWLGIHAGLHKLWQTNGINHPVMNLELFNQFVQLPVA